MIPKLHNKGSSFKGAAAYLLHDADRATTSERVAWTAAHNIATENPEMAWRIMAATAMNQAQLKQRAGIPNTGRKSNKHVLHLSLSWSPEEADTLDRPEMMRAATGALHALGAQDRQAIIICHTDEAHPHVHVLINRVSPADGRMLSSSKEKLKLSKWAQAYEEERGHIYCEERVLNNAARARGEFTRAAKEPARHIYELEQDATDTEAEKIKAEQRQKTAALAAKMRQKKQHRKQAWKALYRRQHDRRNAIRQELKRQKAILLEEVRRDFRPVWKALLHKQREETRSFREREETLIGQAENTLRSMNPKSIMQSGDRKAALKTAFKALASAGARLEALKREQEDTRRQLTAQQKQVEQEAIAALKAEQQQKMQEARRRFQIEREELIFTQRMETAALRAAWHQRRTDRRAVWSRYRQDRLLHEKKEQAQSTHSKGHLSDEFTQRANPEVDKSRSSGEDERERRRREFLKRQNEKRNREKGRRRDDERD